MSRARAQRGQPPPAVLIAVQAHERLPLTSLHLPSPSTHHQHRQARRNYVTTAAEIPSTWPARSGPPPTPPPTSNQSLIEDGPKEGEVNALIANQELPESEAIVEQEGSTLNDFAASFTWLTQLPSGWTVEWDTASGEDRVE